MTLFKFQTQPGFQDLELPALETGSRAQHIPEIQEIHRCHCFQDIDLLNQYPEYRYHPLHTMYHCLHFGRIIIQLWLAHNANHGVHFKEDLFEP